jgi:uncharacterized protein involved in exopolysaccharide biosynthesis
MTTIHQIQGPVTVAHDPDTFDVRGALLGLYRTAVLEWRLIAVTCAVVLAVAVMYAVWWPPIYEAQATMMSEGDRDTARDSFYGGWTVFRKDDMRTEGELFTSAPVLKEVIEREKLTYADIYHPFGSHLAYLWQTSLVGRGYRRVKEWISPPEADAPSPAEQDKARTLSDMKSGVGLNSIGEANMGVLTVRGPSRRVADIANTLIDVYLEQRLERYRLESVKSIATLTEAADAAEQALRAVEREKIEFMRKNGLGLGIEKEKMEVKSLAELETQAADTRAKIAAMEASLAEIERQLRDEPATRTVSTSFEINIQRESLKQKRLEQQALLVYARTRYREDSPEVKDILGTIAGLEKLIGETSEKVAKSSTDAANSARDDLHKRANELRTDVAGLKAALGAMERRGTQLHTRMAGLPALEAALAEYDREYKFATEKYLNLVGKRAQASVGLAGLRAMPSIRVVAEAVRPDSKVWPKSIILYPLALLAGLVIGLAIAVAKSVVLGRIRREHLLQGHRTSAPFYGLVGVPTSAPRLSVVMPERLAPPATP